MMGTNQKWQLVSLGDLLREAQSGFASGERETNGIIQIRMNNVTTDGNLDWSSILRVPTTKNQIDKYRLMAGDVLFNSTNSPDLVGKTAMFDGHSEPVVFSNHFICMRVDKTRLDPKYLTYRITYLWNQRVFERMCTAWVNQAAVRKEDLLSIKIPLLSLPEQKRIAAILEKADRLRRLRRYALKLSGTYLQAVFLEMFEGKEHLFDVVTIEEIASQEKHSLSSGPFGSNLTSAHYTREGVIVLRGLNISDGEVNLTDVKYISKEKAQELARSEVKPKDIVVVAVGSSGLACKIPQTLPRAIMSQNFNKITPDLNKIDPIYLEYLINSKIVQNQLHQEITDTVRTFLSLTKLKTIKIPLPPLPMQQKFAQVVKKYERLRVQQREAERQAEHLFQTLLHKAFQGELTVDEGDGEVPDVEVEQRQVRESAGMYEVVGGDVHQLALQLE
jgi:type I restriction enzyme S subunit